MKKLKKTGERFGGQGRGKTKLESGNVNVKNWHCLYKLHIYIEFTYN
jgi:hypothetical protein